MHDALVCCWKESGGLDGWIHGRDMGKLMHMMMGDAMQARF